MNPNSSHQWWSRWTVRVSLPYRESHDAPQFLKAIQFTHANFIATLFGKAGEVRVTKQIECAGPTGIKVREEWVLDARVEGHPVHDPDFRARHCERLKDFYQSGFGLLATVKVMASLEAGDTQDGRPPEQLIVLPTLAV